jgi:hypothetical protein
MRPEENLKILAANPYPGRGISVGLDETGTRALQVYWIMGRSANSRNRVFVADGPTLRTAAADPSKVQDPRLIIYNAMRELPKVSIVSNGDQTDTIYDAISSGGSFVKGLESRTYEPDAPNNTARISAVSDLRSGRLLTEISVIKKSPYADAAERQTFQYEAMPRGTGFTVTTYSGDGSPLPRFEGEPYLLPLAGSPKRVAETIWNALDPANRVSLAVKAIDIATGRSSIEIVNAYKAVG